MRTFFLVGGVMLAVAAGCKSGNPQGGAPTTGAPPAAAPAQPVGGEGAAPAAAFDSAPPAGTKAKCPVSGETFTVAADSPRSEHGGKHYAFCCPPCKTKFDAQPTSFINK